MKNIGQIATNLIFARDKYTTEQARRFIKSKGFTPLKKVDTQPNYYRYRLVEPDLSFRSLT